ncbi:enoyl-CoA hydratase [Rothia sp. (in: high G+C Gram-positive bacteria)]|uniref:enoyl-CoA hydratase n=1 Tax=Rothia sp. (in: high G+C Gram-positive bacteria) TaxID=1885016 RepID=UPI0025E1F7E5|nr:enoyl-CoA hydratase [Rothia sp. (in: high G+C Gram-positive bacteria)]
MSIYSAKHRIVTATILAAGLQCGLVVPSVAAEAPVTTHSAVQKTATLTATPNQAEDNQQVQGAASTITMKAQLKDGGYLLRWTGFPKDLEASSVLVDVNFYTPSGEYGGSVLESPTLAEGTKEGEFRLLMSPATDSNVVYVIVLEDTAHGVSYEFFVTERGNRLVEAADPRNGKAKPTEPPVDIEREEAETAEASATPSPEAVNLPSPTATSSTDTNGDTVRRTVDNLQNKDSGQYVISEDNSVYDPMNQRKGKAHMSIQDSQGDSQDDTKPVTVRATNFPQNDKGYDLIVMEIDSNGNTVGDALAIVHVGPESISAGAFEAVIGVPGASLQIGKTYLVAAFDAAGDGNLQLNTVRFTVTQASSEGGGSSSNSSSVNEEKPVTVPSASASETADAPAAGSKSKTRGIQADTAMAPGTNDATISVPRAAGSPATASSSALGYRTGEAQPVEVATPESNLPSGTDSAAQSRRAAILNGSSSQVRTDPGSPNGVKATEAQITRNMDKSSPLLPILVTLGGGLILGALGMSRMHASKKD